MARKSKQKGSAKASNAGGSANADLVGMSVNQRILKQAHDLYTDPENGLVEIAAGVGMKLLTPRKKVSVMLIGNHSAGKSSFINWYIGEHVLNTGVAIETQGFTFVTSGKRRDTLKGGPTLELFEQFQCLSQFKGVKETLETEISTSKAKKFPMLLLIDTPGLVDGNMVYPFNINEAIIRLADKVDVVLVFFDPIGQALCSRTMNIVTNISNTHPEKLRYYVTKIDNVPSEQDRQKVLIQITQNLSAHIQHRTALTLPTIFIPDDSNRSVNIANGIDDLCSDIEKTIDQAVQNTLSNIETDCEKIVGAIDYVIADNKSMNAANRMSKLAGFGYLLASLMFSLLCFAFVVADYSLLTPKSEGAERPVFVEYIASFVGASGMAFLADAVPEEYSFHAIGAFSAVALLLFILFRVKWGHTAGMSNAAIAALEDQKAFIKSHVLKVRTDLFEEYFKQAVTADEL